MTTLAQLKTKINKLIENQGEESPVAAFIYTKEDVVEYDDDGDEVEIEDDRIIEDVLYEVEYIESIYTYIHESIEDELRHRS